MSPDGNSRRRIRPFRQLELDALECPINSISEFILALDEFMLKLGGTEKGEEEESSSSLSATECQVAAIWARGVPDCRFCLNPSLLRRKEIFGKMRTNDRIKTLLEIEEELFSLFQTRMPSTGHPYEFRGDQLELMSVMQHYGSPTRLLDWSGSPFSALFFALENYLAYMDRARESSGHVPSTTPGVWLFRPRKYNFAIHGEDRIFSSRDEPHIEEMFTGSRMKSPKAIMPSYITPRITAQQARFTLHSFEADGIENAFNKEGYDAATSWLKLIAIRPSSIPEMMGKLRDMGVHEFSQFPDMWGLGAYGQKLWREICSKKSGGLKPPIMLGQALVKLGESKEKIDKIVDAAKVSGERVGRTAQMFGVKPKVILDAIDLTWGIAPWIPTDTPP